MHLAWDIAALQLALAMLLDVVIGEYPNFMHPVVWIGKTVKAVLLLAPSSRWWAQFLFGIVMVAIVGTMTGGATFCIMYSAKNSYLGEIVIGAVLLKASFALCELGRAAFRVVRPLQEHDLGRAREALRSLCSRDPADFEAKQLLEATVESLAENASDSFVAPVFYFVLFGVPGAMVYRAINTMDSMIGYRGKYEALGKAAARLDDVVNWIPARLAAGLLLFVGWMCGYSLADGWRIMRRDGAKTPSPNGGRPMAAMAGLLGVRLEKKDVYVLGDPVNELTTDTVRSAWKLVVGMGMAMLTLAFAFCALGYCSWFSHD